MDMDKKSSTIKDPSLYILAEQVSQLVQVIALQKEVSAPSPMVAPIANSYPVTPNFYQVY